jgi:hypothetical protein
LDSLSALTEEVDAGAQSKKKKRKGHKDLTFRAQHRVEEKELPEETQSMTRATRTRSEARAICAQTDDATILTILDTNDNTFKKEKIICRQTTPPGVVSGSAIEEEFNHSYEDNPIFDVQTGNVILYISYFRTNWYIVGTLLIDVDNNYDEECDRNTSQMLIIHDCEQKAIELTILPPAVTSANLREPLDHDDPQQSTRLSRGDTFFIPRENSYR